MFQYFILLIIFWNSQRDYFWFAFLLILINEPGLLFHGSLKTDVNRIPLYNIGAGLSLSFFDLFYITAFIKALMKGSKTRILLKKPLLFLFL